jgi:hypothetical protein
MSQDRQSGARANEWGRKKSKEIARALNATELSTNSNECTLSGKRVVIKCANVGNNKIGVPYKMLPRVTQVIAAFARPDGSFDLIGISPFTFQKAMGPTASTGKSSGKVGMVPRPYFEAHAEWRTTIRTSPAA